jgi:predicted lipoprotein
MNKGLYWAVLSLISLAVIFWFFPLLHIVRIDASRGGSSTGPLNSAALAQNFWKEKLVAAAEKSPAISDLWKALADNPAGAQKKFGHSPGMSSVTYFLVQGTGKVTAIEKDLMRLAIDNPPPEFVDLSTGLVFGNALRDATGLLNGSDFPNSQDFNELSTELNRIAETSVVPVLREKAVAGATLHFTGCVELDEGELPKVPRIIPVTVMVK